jgi:hypothetical protein
MGCRPSKALEVIPKPLERTTQATWRDGCAFHPRDESGYRVYINANCRSVVQERFDEKRSATTKGIDNRRAWLRESFE